MSLDSAPWVLILAAGEGRRVRAFTRDRWGHSAPKQFTSIDGEVTLLGATLRRARGIAPPKHIVTIVAAQHERWWKSELEGIPSENIIVQPKNRGTAAGVLVPALWIAQHDPNGTVVILPSDHHVDSEETLHDSLSTAVSAVSRSDAPIVLLGIEPIGPEEEYGWILPCPGPENCPHRVISFKEKPDACTAASLLSKGGLLNTFIIVAESQCLLGLFRDKAPRLWQPFAQMMTGRSEEFWRRENLSNLYHAIPTLDFSKDILEDATENLWVYPVPQCGWTDLGTPRRLTDQLTRQGAAHSRGPTQSSRLAPQQP